MNLADFTASLLTRRHQVALRMSGRSALGREARADDQRLLITISLLLHQAELFTRNERLSIVDSLTKYHV